MPKRNWCAVEYTNGLPLVQALWWFIENMQYGDPQHNELFFRLRARYRDEVQK